jgi:hypothetical protein
MEREKELKHGACAACRLAGIGLGYGRHCCQHCLPCKARPLRAAIINCLRRMCGREQLLEAI